MIYLISNQINAFGGKFEQISLQEGINKVKDLKFIGLDTETEGLDPHTKKLLTLQLGNKEEQIVFDISSYDGRLPIELIEFLNNSKSTFIIQNAKFDLQFLYKQGVILDKVYDTMLVETIITNGFLGVSRSLKAICLKYFDVDLDKTVRGQIITKGLNAAVIEYAAYDVYYLEDIMNEQMKLVEGAHLQNAVRLDNEFVKMLAYMEFCGIKLDLEKWKKRANEDLVELVEKKNKLNDWLLQQGHTKYFSGMLDMFTEQQDCLFNWDSPKQVLELFESMGINCVVKQGGEERKSVEEKVIGKFKKDFPILELYFDYKGKAKQCSTYGLSWESMINTKTGRIHTSFKQLMNTGRLSSGDSKANKPNLQNLPGDHYTRSCFIAEKGNKFIAVDYSSQEQIILANFSLEPNLINFYKKGFKDMHSYVAFLMYPDIRRCELEDLTPEKLSYVKQEYSEQRKIAKNAGFAINYGGNGVTIARNCNIPQKDGEFVYNKYFENFPGLREYFDRVMAHTMKYQHVTYNSATNRKLFLDPSLPLVKYKPDVDDPFFWRRPDAKSIHALYRNSLADIQRVSQNYPIQGTAADCSKLAGVILFNELKKRNLLFKVLVVNMVHDEFCVEAPEEMAEEISQLVVDCMEKAGTIFCKVVPLRAEPAIGNYWIH